MVMQGVHRSADSRARELVSCLRALHVFFSHPTRYYCWRATGCLTADGSAALSCQDGLVLVLEKARKSWRSTACEPQFITFILYWFEETAGFIARVKFMGKNQCLDRIKLFFKRVKVRHLFGAKIGLSFYVQRNWPLKVFLFVSREDLEKMSEQICCNSSKGIMCLWLIPYVLFFVYY